MNKKKLKTKEEVRTMRKSILVALAMAVLFAWAWTASAFQLEFHGTYGTKIQTTNTLGMVGKEGLENWNEFAPVDEIGNQDLDDTWAELQFRLWTVATSDDGNVKGVWAMEYGTKRFGEAANDGMAFANDEDDIEARLMYLDFQLPYFCSENRLTVGLQWIDVNEWLWHESAAGIKNYGSFMVGQTKVDYQLGWARQADSIDRNSPINTNDNDFWFAKVDFELKELLKVDKFDIGAFFVYANQAQDQIQPWWAGLEVDFEGYKGILFDLDFIYMGGDSDNPLVEDDLQGWFVHATAGYQWTDQFKTTFTFWYASGDDDPTDGDYEAYNTIITHTYDSVVLFEDATFDDCWYASGNPYLDPRLGFYMFRFKADYQATPKLNLAAAVNYMQLDEDVEYAGDSDDNIGWEVDVYADYELYKNFKVNFAAGYLFTDDAMDIFAARATDGAENDADDMYRVTVGVTYSF